MTDQIFSPYLGDWLTATCSFNRLSALEGKDILLREASSDSTRVCLKEEYNKKDYEGKTLLLIFFLKIWERAVMRKKNIQSIS